MEENEDFLTSASYVALTVFAVAFVIPTIIVCAIAWVGYLLTIMAIPQF